MVIVIYQFTHPHWHDYYYESSCTHKQRQAQMDTLTNVILRARVPGPHAVDHRVHHRGLAVVPHYDLVLRRQYVAHPARFYPLLVRASVLL